MIAGIKYNDPNFMKQFIPTDSVKHRSPEFDVARTKVKMQTLFALEKVTTLILMWYYFSMQETS